MSAGEILVGEPARASFHALAHIPLVAAATLALLSMASIPVMGVVGSIKKWPSA